MKLNNVEIEDTFAEAFEMHYSRLLITARNKRLAFEAAKEACGFATSIIACSAEAGTEGKFFGKSETPDSRVGVAIQIWVARKEKMEKELIARIGQCILTAPTAAIWNLTESDEKVKAGEKLRFFGDGYESFAEINSRKAVKIPIMLGYFIAEREFGIAKGIAGGNLIIQAKSEISAVNACLRAAKAARSMEGVITPFVLGMCASGSKVGAKKYSFMHATTNELFCPALKEIVKESKVKEGVNAVGEIVINAISEDRLREAMKKALIAASKSKGVRYISAANYGGKLGNVKINLGELF